MCIYTVPIKCKILIFSQMNFLQFFFQWCTSVQYIESSTLHNLLFHNIVSKRMRIHGLNDLLFNGLEMLYILNGLNLHHGVFYLLLVDVLNYVLLVPALWLVPVCHQHLLISLLYNDGLWIDSHYLPCFWLNSKLLLSSWALLTQF